MCGELRSRSDITQSRFRTTSLSPEDRCSVRARADRKTCVPLGLANAQVGLPTPFDAWTITQAWETYNELICDSMFIGEFCCGLPLLYKYFTSPVKITAIGAVAPESSLFNRLLSRLHFGTASEPGYTHLPVDDALEPDEDEAVILDLDDRLRGWRVLWLWIPAFFDSM